MKCLNERKTIQELRRISVTAKPTSHSEIYECSLILRQKQVFSFKCAVEVFFLDSLDDIPEMIADGMIKYLITAYKNVIFHDEATVELEGDDVSDATLSDIFNEMKASQNYWLEIEPPFEIYLTGCEKEFIKNGRLLTEKAMIECQIKNRS